MSTEPLNSTSFWSLENMHYGTKVKTDPCHFSQTLKLEGCRNTWHSKLTWHKDIKHCSFSLSCICCKLSKCSKIHHASMEFTWHASIGGVKYSQEHLHMDVIHRHHISNFIPSCYILPLYQWHFLCRPPSQWSVSVLPVPGGGCLPSQVLIIMDIVWHPFPPRDRVAIAWH